MLQSCTSKVLPATVKRWRTWSVLHPSTGPARLVTLATESLTPPTVPAHNCEFMHQTHTLSCSWAAVGDVISCYCKGGECMRCETERGGENQCMCWCNQEQQGNLDLFAAAADQVFIRERTERYEKEERRKEWGEEWKRKGRKHGWSRENLKTVKERKDQKRLEARNLQRGKQVGK